MGIRYASAAPPTADLVVIGGGIAGAATAFWAARAGRRPLILERRPALATLTTQASTGAFRLQFDNRRELELVRETVDLLDHFRQLTGQDEFDPAVRRQGYLWATTDPDRAGYQRELVGRQHRWGQTDIELLDGDEARRRFPYLAPTVIQARYRAGDGFLDPVRLTLGLVAGSGAEVVVRCEVEEVHVGAGAVRGVTTSAGRIATGTVVIAAGPFSASLAETVGVALPVTTVPRHKLVLPVAPQVPPQAPMTIDDDTGTHWRPALQGAFVLYTDPATRPGPPVEDVAPSAEFAFRVLEPDSPVTAARIAPFWREVWRQGPGWFIQSGQYTMTPDHRPLLGESPISGLYVNTGYSGHGIMAAPAGSRLLADLLAGQRDEASNPFRLGRDFVDRPADLL